MIQKIFYFFILFFIISKVSYTEEKLLYQPAKVLKVEEKSSSDVSPSPRFPSQNPYNEPSQDERKHQEGDAMTALFSNLTESNHAYFITLQLDDRMIKVKYDPAWKWSRKPDFMVGSNVQVRFNLKKDKVFIRQSNNKEFESKLLFEQKTSS